MSQAVRIRVTLSKLAKSPLSYCPYEGISYCLHDLRVDRVSCLLVSNSVNVMGLEVSLKALKTHNFGD